MASSSSVQFFGLENVITAYNNAAVQVWAIFQGKQFITPGSGEEQLKTFLTMLAENESSCTYTLKVYRSLDNSDEVTDKTECSGSFNFRLFAGSGMKQNAVGAFGTRMSGTDLIMEKISGIVAEEVEDVIARRFSGEGEERDDIGSILMGYLKEPDKLIGVINAIRGISSPGTAFEQTEAYPRRVMGTVTTENLEERQQRLVQVLNRLEQADPEILNHLEKLADLARDKPGVFKMAIASLTTL